MKDTVTPGNPNYNEKAARAKLMMAGQAGRDGQWGPPAADGKTEYAHDNDMDGHAISHLGWGLNPQGRWDAIALNGADPKRHNANARVFAGNFLFSTGPNSQGGGTRTTKGHYDVPMRDCTVALDNDVIIERGRFVDDKMRVARVAR